MAPCASQCVDLRALDALRAAADDLYSSAYDDTARLDAVRRAGDALRRVDPDCVGAAELERASALIACLALPPRHGNELRAAANRLYQSALLMLEPHQPGPVVHLMLLRVLLRGVLLDAEEGRAASAERAVLFARAAWRALALESGLASSPSYRVLERVLASAHAAAQSDRPAPLADAARAALLEVDVLDAEHARESEGEDWLRRSGGRARSGGDRHR